MRSRLHGFTLIELMVTVAVLGVVVAIAAPSFNKQILNSQSVTLGDDLVAQVNVARLEAIRRAKLISICASTDGTSCGVSATWNDGFLLFVDGATTETSTSVVISQVVSHWKNVNAKADISVVNKGPSSDTPVTFFRFNSLGNLARVGSSANPIVLTSKVTGCTASDKARQIAVSLSGMVSVKKTGC